MAAKKYKYHGKTEAALTRTYGHYASYKEKAAIPFTPHHFNQEIRMALLPRVYFTRRAYEDMLSLVDLVQGEVGWIGSVRNLGRGDYLVEEIFLPAQAAHGATCEISEAGLANWAIEIMASREDGMEIANSIRFWGHSHHTMATNPSQQDKDTLKELAEGCGDYFIRAICNKHGRIEITISLCDVGILVHDVEWGVYEPRDTSRRDHWKEEIEKNVVEMKFGSLVDEIEESGTLTWPISSHGNGGANGNSDWHGFLSEEELAKIDNENGKERSEGQQASDAIVLEVAGPENKWKGTIPPSGYQDKGGM